MSLVVLRQKNLGNEEMAIKYDENFAMRAEAIERLLWNEKDGTYYDYQLSSNTQNKFVKIKNVAKNFLSFLQILFRLLTMKE